MSKMRRVTVSLPPEVLAFVEEDRRVQGVSRSEYVTRALERTMERRREERLVEEFRAAYAARPETAEEAAFAEGAAAGFGDSLRAEEDRG
jgi:metal-responsive CopG/Arc/MetJ family transcriptional regulator